MNASHQFHPLADLFPMMGPDELEPIIASMKAAGYDKTQPVVMLEGKILDGRNRYAAAIAAGVEATFAEFRDAWGEPFKYVIQHNLHRRHLSASQRAMIAAKLANLLHGQRKQKPNGLHAVPVPDASIEASGKPTPKEAVSQADAASEMDVSRANVQRASKVVKAADETLAVAVEAGDIAVSDAAAIVDQPRPVQAKADEKVRRGEARTAREAVAQMQEEQGEPAEAGEPCDKFGSTWPAKALPAVAEMGTIQGLYAKLAVIDKELRRLSQIPACKRIGTWEMATHLKRIRDTLNVNQPYAVCPKCNGGDTGAERCPNCQSDGWVTKEGYTRGGYAEKGGFDA